SEGDDVLAVGHEVVLVQQEREVVETGSLTRSRRDGERVRRRVERIVRDPAQRLEEHRPTEWCQLACGEGQRGLTGRALVTWVQTVAPAPVRRVEEPGPEPDGYLLRHREAGVELGHPLRVRED